MMILKVSAFGKLVHVGGEKNMMWGNVRGNKHIISVNVLKC